MTRRLISIPEINTDIDFDDIKTMDELIDNVRDVMEVYIPGMISGAIIDSVPQDDKTVDDGLAVVSDMSIKFMDEFVEYASCNSLENMKIYFQEMLMSMLTIANAVTTVMNVQALLNKKDCENQEG